MAKPLVETLQLKKDKERNPRIRETQVFQEFQHAVKVHIELYSYAGGVSDLHLKASSEGVPAPSLFSVYPSWSVTAAIGQYFPSHFEADPFVF